MCSLGCTFGTILDQKGVAPGFDFLRLFLATSVVLWHAFYFTHPHDWAVTIWNGPFGPLVNCIVPSFFALSGFLVTGSLERLRSLRAFLTFRALRILPALLVEVTLSALFLGPIITSRAASAYFENEQTALYFTNIVGFIRYHLPGVFDHQYYSTVNGALWSVPGEMTCYLSLAALVICGIGLNKKLVLLAFTAVTITLYLVTRHIGAFSTQNWIPLVLCFYAGSVLYYYRHYVPQNVVLLFAAIAIAYYVMYFRYGLYIVFGPISIAYVTCFFGMTRLPHIKYLMDGDHSYGLYLYHSPIVQTFIWLSGATIAWWAVFFIAYPTVFLFAAISWRFIEKPTLALRRRLLPSVVPA